MIKLIFMLKRRTGMGVLAFREHYENSHVPLAQNYVGHLLKGYLRNYPQSATLNPSGQGAGPPPIADIPYDAIAEMWVEDQAALEEMGRIFNHPDISPILAADEVRFLEREQTLMLICEEVDTGTGAPGGV